eukprot:457138-Rhodomonas_salina.1
MGRDAHADAEAALAATSARESASTSGSSTRSDPYPLPPHYALPGTAIPHIGIVLCARYAMSGTNIPYAAIARYVLATRCPVLRQRMLLPQSMMSYPWFKAVSYTHLTLPTICSV